jgi:precorrin-6B methylase 2
VQVILVKRGEASMRLQIRWRSKASGGLPAKLFSPRIADASFLPLPASLWGLAYLLRPVRIVLKRAGLVSAPSIQAPFLATPSELIDPLFALAGLNRTDVLLDFGCGDGRIAIEAAKRVGCRALGVDTNAKLIQLANQRARQAGVADRVEFSCKDASKARLDEVSVVFIFMPATDIAQAMESLLGRVKPGTRIIAHEQEELSQAIAPDMSRPLIGRSIVSVAHLWVAR